MKPTLLGYLAVATADALAQGRASLAEYAAKEGFTLAEVYVDLTGQDAAFYQLLQQIQVGEASAVVVPDLGHLAHLGCLAEADRRTASRFVRAPVLIAMPAR
jgi:hypothetical protein